VRTILCETTVVSDLLIDEEAKRKTSKMGLDDALLAITPFTFGEMTFGALNAGWSAGRLKRLENHLRAFQVVGVDADVGRVFGQLLVACRRAGRDKGDWNSSIDLWIAATAVRHHLPLATLDRGFDDIPGLQLVQLDGSEILSPPFTPSPAD